MKLKVRKFLAIILSLLVVALYSLVPFEVAYADTSTVTPTPTPTPTTSTTNITNSNTTQNTTNTNSNTGNNSINTTPTPTPTANPSPSPTPGSSPADPSPSPAPTPTPAPSGNQNITATNSANVANNVNSNSNSGNNSILASGSATLDATASGSLDSTPSAETNGNKGNGNSNAKSNSINTGNAVSVTNQQNSVNSTSVNSNVFYQTINIYVTQNGDINLSDPLTLATYAVQSHPNDPVVDMSVTNVNNYAYISNDINSNANSGGNAIKNSSGSATIKTGNAYSVVNLLNQVNFTIINSTIHVVTINIFGQLNGNIILPETFTSTNCGCGVNLNASSSAGVINNINSNANSGNNTITASGSANIKTGDTQSSVNIENIVNLNLINSVAESLYINLMGGWNGSFIGWYSFNPSNPSADLVFTNISGTQSANTTNNVNNLATLVNNVNSNANTGGNIINAGSGNINTGTAYSAVSLINFVNSTFINTYGFFGFLNIFGNWNGNIGGQKEFDALNAQTNSNTNNSSSNNSSTNSSNTMEQGGILQVTNSNNTGEYVNPGDTVTFFIDTSNIGTGKVYNAQLQLYLIHNGQNVGGTAFNLGDIEKGQGVNLSTGFVLSKTTPPGYYIARAVVVGKVGPNNAFVTAFADSHFNVSGENSITLTNNSNQQTNSVGTPLVLGTHTPSVILKSSSDDQTPLYELLAVVMAYLTLRSIRERKRLEEIFRSNSFKEKIVALRMFLL